MRRLFRISLTAFLLTLFSLFWKVSDARAQTLNVSPTVAGCGQRVTFTASGMDSGLTYNLRIICSSGTSGCAGQDFTLTSFSGSDTRTYSLIFNIDGSCTGGDLVAGSGVFRTFLWWTDNDNQDGAVAGPDLTLAAQAGNCILSLDPNPLYTGLQGVISLSNANPNTYYNISFDNNACTTPNPTVMTTSSGSLTSTFSCTAPGNYTAMANSTDTISPRDCTDTIEIIGSSTDCASRPGTCRISNICPIGCELTPPNEGWPDCSVTTVCCRTDVECCLSTDPYACGGTPPVEDNPYGALPIPRPTPIPCDETRGNEFHSLRPYQASPCNRDATDLALYCGNDFILIDTITIDKIYSDGDMMLGLDWEYIFEGEPIDISQEQPEDSYLACSYCNSDGFCVVRTGPCNPDMGCQYDSNNCVAPTCVDNGDGTETCNFIVDRQVDIAIDLDGTELPIMGYTEPSEGTTDPYTVINRLNSNETLNDPGKVNEYVSWYLNGVIGRAEYDPPDRDFFGRLTDEGHDRIVNYSGPLKRLLSYDSQIFTRWDEVQDARISVSSDCDPNETDPSDPDCIRHNQIIGCYNIFRQPVACSSLGAISRRLTNWIYPPPLRQNYSSDLLYSLAYRTWQRFHPHWRLFSYIPFSSTEDRKGEVEITRYTVQPPSSGNVLILNSAIVNQIPSTLFFSHMQETYELAEILQSVFSPQEADLDARALSSAPAYRTQCNIVEYRRNPGDNLFATELSATVEYTAQVTCNFMTPVEPGDGRICNAGTGGEGECYPLPQDDWYCSTYYGQVDCQATEFCGVNCNPPREPIESEACQNRAGDTDYFCFPNEWDYREECPMPVYTGTLYCPRGYTCAHNTCYTRPTISPVITPFSYTESCTNQVPVSFRTVTKTPLANEVWSKLVAGPAGAFRRIFPQIEDEEGRPIRRLWDIPAATDVTFSTSGNVSVVGGDTAHLFFPHIGGVHEYFLNCIQKTLRPQGYGYGCISAPIDIISATSDSCPAVPDSEVPGDYLGMMKENFIRLADAWVYAGSGCSGPENNLAEECYNYVVREASNAGINPAFALTIWLNESDASNYCFGGPTTQDFGIFDSSIYMNLIEQLERFLALPNNYEYLNCQAAARSRGLDPMFGFLDRFRDGECDLVQNCSNLGWRYYNNLRGIDCCNPRDACMGTWVVVTEPLAYCVTSTGRFSISWPDDNSCP